MNLIWISGVVNEVDGALLPARDELADDVIEFVMRSDPKPIGSVVANARQCAIL